MRCSNKKKMAWQKLASSPSAWCSYERFLLLQAGSPCLCDTPPSPLLTCALIFLSKDQCSVFKVQRLDLFPLSHYLTLLPT